jgi:hypothetical protein
VGVLELSRLWAPDGHEPNELTRLIASAARLLRKDAPACELLVSFADPNQGHTGGVYRAASWHYCGQSSERRGYRTADGLSVSRRSFHSGSTSLPDALPMHKQLGKLRYIRPLTRRARRSVRIPILPYDRIPAVC